MALTLARGCASTAWVFSILSSDNMAIVAYRSWALSNSEYCPVGGPERSWVTWSGGMPR